MKKLFFVVAVSLIFTFICTACEITETSMASHTHQYGEWAVIRQATCSIEGEMIRDCNCGESETRIVEKTQHTWIEATQEAPKTCTGCGATEGSKLEKSLPTAIFSNSNFLVVYKDGSASARLDNLQAQVYEQSDGKYKVELILKGTMKRVPFESSWPFNYRILISGDEGLLYDSDTQLSTPYYEGESVSIYEKIRDLPYSNTYKITIL